MIPEFESIAATLRSAAYRAPYLLETLALVLLAFPIPLRLLREGTKRSLVLWHSLLLATGMTLTLFLIAGIQLHQLADARFGLFFLAAGAILALRLYFGERLARWVVRRWLRWAPRARRLIALEARFHGETLVRQVTTDAAAGGVLGWFASILGKLSRVRGGDPSPTRFLNDELRRAFLSAHRALQEARHRRVSAPKVQRYLDTAQAYLESIHRVTRSGVQAERLSSNASPVAIIAGVLQELLLLDPPHGGGEIATAWVEATLPILEREIADGEPEEWGASEFRAPSERWLMEVVRGTCSGERTPERVLHWFQCCSHRARSADGLEFSYPHEALAVTLVALVLVEHGYPSLALDLVSESRWAPTTHRDADLVPHPLSGARWRILEKFEDALPARTTDSDFDEPLDSRERSIALGLRHEALVEAETAPQERAL